MIRTKQEDRDVEVAAVRCDLVWTQAGARALTSVNKDHNGKQDYLKHCVHWCPTDLGIKCLSAYRLSYASDAVIADLAHYMAVDK